MINRIIGAFASEPGSHEPDPQAVPALSGVDPSRKCLTPETYYSVSQESARCLSVRVRFPFDIDDWAGGNSAIADTPEGVDPQSDADRLRRYEQRYSEQRRIVELIHDQMEAVAADCYRVLQERDLRIGKDSVDYGVRHARWRRTRQGDRPHPASGIAARSDETPTAAQPEARARAEGDAKSQ